MLPGPQYALYPALRLAIGSRDERGLPRKDGFFTVRRLDEGSSNRYVIDERLQALLREVTGEEQPKRVPVVFLSNDVEQNVRSRLALYQGGRPACSCGQFVLKEKSLLHEQGIPQAQPDEFGTFPTSHYQGIAERNWWVREGERVELRGTESVPCDPATCPFAQPAADTPEFRRAHQALFGRQPSAAVLRHSVRLCRPQVVATVLLPWVETEVPWARYTSTAWGTYRALFTSLRNIANATGGLIAGLEVEFVLQHRPAQTPQGLQRVPYVTVEPQVAWSRVAKQAREAVALREQNIRAVRLLEAGLDNVREGRAFQGEFHPRTDATDLAIPTETERLRALAEAAGWTQGQLEARLARCASAEDRQALLAELEGLTRFDGPIDAHNVRDAAAAGEGDASGEVIEGEVEPEDDDGDLYAELAGLIRDGLAEKDAVADFVRPLLAEAGLRYTADGIRSAPPEVAAQIRDFIRLARED